MMLEFKFDVQNNVNLLMRLSQEQWPLIANNIYMHVRKRKRSTNTADVSTPNTTTMLNVPGRMCICELTALWIFVHQSQ